jgi:hypothetical protein
VREERQHLIKLSPVKPRLVRANEVGPQDQLLRKERLGLEGVKLFECEMQAEYSITVSNRHNHLLRPQIESLPPVIAINRFNYKSCVQKQELQLSWEIDMAFKVADVVIRQGASDKLMIKKSDMSSLFVRQVAR